MRYRPRYVVELYGGNKLGYMWKKDIAKAYNINYGRVNQSLINHEWVWDGYKTLRIKVRYHTCKDCPDYMLESKYCKSCMRDMEI